MPYLNEATGETLTYAQIEEKALLEDTSAFDYISKHDLQMVSSMSSFEEPQDINFQTGIANQGANAMSTIPGAPEITDLDSTTSSLESYTERQTALANAPVTSAIADRDKFVKDNKLDEFFSLKGGKISELDELNKKIQDKERELRNAPENQFAPATFLDEEPKFIQNFLQQEFGTTGITFNLDESNNFITANVGGEELKLPLTGDRILGSGGTDEDSTPFANYLYKNSRKEFKENYDKIIKYDISRRAAAHVENYNGVMMETIEKDIVSNALSNALENGDVSLTEFNNTFNETGLELVPVTEVEEYTEGGFGAKVKERTVLTGYNLVKKSSNEQGEEVQDIVAFQKIKKDEFVDGNDLQAWLSSNLDSDQTLKVKKNIFNFISAYTTEEAKIQTQTIQSINPQQIDAKVSKGEGNWIEKLTGDDGLLSRLNVETQSEVFNKQERNTIQLHFANQLKLANPLRAFTTPSKNSSTGFLTEKIESTQTPYEIATSLEGLPETIKNKLEGTYEELDNNSPLDVILENSKNIVKQGLLTEKENSLMENLMEAKEIPFTDSNGNVSMIPFNTFMTGLGALLKGKKDEIIDDNLQAFKNGFEEVDEKLKQTVNLGAEIVAETFKSNPNLPVDFNVTIGDNQELFYSLKPTKKLTEKEQTIYDELQVDLFKWETTAFKLNKERSQAVSNYLNTIISFNKNVKENKEEKERSKEGLIENLTQSVNPKTKENYTLKEAKELANDIRFRDSSMILKLANKEYDAGALMVNDFYQASKGILLAIPTLSGNEYAIDEQRQINKNAELYQTMGTYNDGLGSGFEFAGRTLAQQMPNIILAVATGAAGNATGFLSTTAVKAAVATTFGTTAGADIYRNLTLGTELVAKAKDQVKFLKDAYSKGLVSALEYTEGMADANQTIAYNDLTQAQILGASAMTFAIEGGITFMIGSGNNTLKFLDDVAGKSTGSLAVTNLVKNSAWKNAGLFGIDYTKRLASEVVEEELIYGGTQLFSETLILNRNFDLSQLDDTAITTIITAGTSNSSVAYSALTNISMSEDIRKAAGELHNGKIVNVLKSLNLAKTDKDRAPFLLTLAEHNIALSDLSGEAGVDAMALGDKMQSLLALKIIKDNLYAQAGVKGDGKNVNRVIGQYKSKLNANQKKAFEDDLAAVESEINSIRNSEKNYQGVINQINGKSKNYKPEFKDGKRKKYKGIYEITADQLKGDSKFDKASERGKIGLVLEKIRNNISNTYTAKAEQNKFFINEWNKIIKENPKLKNKKQQYFENAGKEIAFRTVNLTTILSETDSAKEIVKNFDDLKLVEAPDGNLQEELNRMLQDKEITDEDYTIINKSLEDQVVDGKKVKVNGFVTPDGKFIVNNVSKKYFEDTGNIQAGTVMVHEINHIIDDKFFGNTLDKSGDAVLSKRGKQFVDNLHKHMSETEDITLKMIQVKALRAVNIYGKEKWDDNSDKYKDEYAREVQTLLFAEESRFKDGTNYEKQEKFNLLNKTLNTLFGKGENMSSPQKAFDYIVANNAAARKGKLREIVQRGIDKFGGESGGKRSVNPQSVVDRINEKNKSVENFTPITEKQVQTMVDKVANRTWSRFGRPIPANIREKFIGSKGDESGRKKWVDDARQILNTIALGFDASKASFGQYMANTGMQRANAWAKNEFGIPSAEQGARVNVETSKEAQGTLDNTQDFTERQAKESSETLPSLKNTIKSKNKKSLLDNIEKGVEKEVKYKQPAMNKASTIKSKSELISNLSKGLQNVTIDGKNLYAKVIDDIGGRNKTINEFETFLSENYTSLLQSGGLTTSYLSKAFPQAIEKYIVGEGWVKYPGWKGKKKGKAKGDVDIWSSTESGPFQGSTSGLQKIRRIPNIKNAIPLAQFKGKYIDGINNKVKVAPTEALAKQLVQEIGLDVFNEEIQKETSVIKELFKERQDLVGALTDISNFEAQINLDVERRGIKNSLATLSPQQFENWTNKRFEFYAAIEDLRANGLTSAKVLRAHKNIYGASYTEDEHKNISLQFSRLLSPVNKADMEVFRSTKSFVQYLEDIVEAKDINQTIVEFSGADMSIAQMLRDLNLVLKGREFVVRNVVQALKKKFPVEKHGNKALEMLVAFAPVTFSQGSSFFASYMIEPGTDSKLIKHNKDDNRPSLFGKANEDILKNLILGKDADDKINFPNVKSINNKKITFKDGKTPLKVDINTSAVVQVKHLKGLSEKQIAKDKADAKLARQFVEVVMDALPSKGTDNNLTALILATMNASSDSALRLAAPVWGKSAVMGYKDLKKPKLATAKDVEKDLTGDLKVGDKMYTPKKKNKSGKITGGVLRTEANYRYEHALPARVVLWYLYDSKINKNKKINLDALFDDYRVTIIPIIEMDNVLRDTGFSSIMLANYIPGDQTWWKRYFNRFTKGKIPYALESYEIDAETGKPDIKGQDFQDYYEEKMPPVFKPNSQTIVDQENNADIAMDNARSGKYSLTVKKIRVFDFDDTLARSNSKVLYTMPDGTKGKLTATEFAKDAASMENQGVVWDFTEFSKVVEGKKGPLFNVAKKIQETRGSEDIFVLTARPQNAAQPIQQFLASIGLNIPIENITGLEDGTGKAKADWIINKFAEGYNDFYFTDDAIKNVKAVKDVLDVLDVKSKVQQARAKFSLNLSDEFNQMIERNKGISAEKRYSQVVAQRLGRNKKRWNFFIPPSAEDFRGLTMYMFSGSGKKGEADMEFFNKSLVLPYTRGISAMETARQQVSKDYRGLVAGFPKIKRLLRKKIEGTEFTHDEAVRVYLWDKAGYQIPGISKRDQAKLSKIIREDPNLAAFADGVQAVTKSETYVEPSQHWSGGTILSDLDSLTKSINRNKYLNEFNENVEVIFSNENLNKIEAVYGTRVKEALIDIIQRMKTGSNRTGGKDRIVNKWNDWVNNSIGAIMFLNRRSALLQLISSVNFINWGDNNPAMAALAFSNQPQFWKDVVYLFNSDKLKQRRSGLKGDINEAEIAAAVKGARNKTQAFISVLLKYGFTFTQIADSVAIATGGATMYRNRTNTYLKQGFSKAEAETKAFIDFSLISDESQQSADPMLISKQQAGVMGRLILAFQNTPMQYTRLMKKAGLDIINGRGDLKTNISKIMYYGAVQNFIFSALQNALFALVPGFEDDDDELTEEEQMEAYGKVLSKKQDRILNGMLDTILRGSGLAGAVISTIKNAIRTYGVQDAKGYMADHTYTIVELANLSPPIGSKLRKIYSGIQTKRIERDPIAERGFDVTINGKFNLSPSYQVVGDIASGVANIPLDRLVVEINAITEALDERNTIYQRIALALGYRTWDANTKNEEEDLIKVEGKAKRKEEGKIKAKATRERKKKEKFQKYLNSLSADEYIEYLQKKQEFEEAFK